jgi:hypothetical protein
MRRKTRDPPCSSDPIIAMAKKINKPRSLEKPDKRDIFCQVQEAFRLAARKTSAVLGTAWAFIGAVSVIIVSGD